MQTIQSIVQSNNPLEPYDYKYQKELTENLDKLDGDFSQNILNEIVLWKVNRYALIKKDILQLLNQLSKEDSEIDIDFTRIILDKLLNTNGIQLAMASTILRFKNPNIYQIIDQRVYRFIYGEIMKEPYSIVTKIDFYIGYLEKLRDICDEYNLDFSLSDRQLYALDKKYNPDFKIKY